MNIGGKNMNSKEFAELMWLYRNNSITKPVLERHVLAELIDAYLKVGEPAKNDDLVNVPSRVYPLR